MVGSIAIATLDRSITEPFKIGLEIFSEFEWPLVSRVQISSPRCAWTTPGELRMRSHAALLQYLFFK